MMLQSAIDEYASHAKSEAESRRATEHLMRENERLLDVLQAQLKSVLGANKTLTVRARSSTQELSTADLQNLTEVEDAAQEALRTLEEAGHKRAVPEPEVQKALHATVPESQSPLNAQGLVHEDLSSAVEQHEEQKGSHGGTNSEVLSTLTRGADRTSSTTSTEHTTQGVGLVNADDVSVSAVHGVRAAATAKLEAAIQSGDSTHLAKAIEEARENMLADQDTLSRAQQLYQMQHEAQMLEELQDATQSIRVLREALAVAEEVSNHAYLRTTPRFRPILGL